MDFFLEWNLMNSQQGNNEVPKVADFLGVSKSIEEGQSDTVANNYNHGDDYIFQNNGLAQVVHQSSVISAASAGGAGAYDYQENNPGNNLQALTLSMGSGKVSTCPEVSADNVSDTTTTAVVEAATPRRTLDTFGQRTSIYRGVTRHRWTGRYEAHLWDNSCRREGQSRKGRQVYLGGYDKEEKAARAYDLAALKYWGTSTTTNFPISNYEKEVEEMKHMTRQEFVASIRRKSSGFSRGASMYRGVTRHHQHGRWQARIGRVAGNKDLYLGTFSTEEEAAEAYDIAAIKFRGLNAVTNFDMNRYDVKSILESNTLPIGGGAAKRLKEAQALESSRKREEMLALTSTFQYGSPSANVAAATSSARLHQAYPLSVYDHHHHAATTTLLSLQQNYQSDPSFHGQSYLQTAQQQPGSLFSFGGYGGGVQSHHHHHQQQQGFMMDGHHVLDGSLGYSNDHLGTTTATSMATGSVNGEADQELSLVKVDYDVSSGNPSGGGYGGWLGSGSGHGSNNGVFPMWND